MSARRGGQRGVSVKNLTLVTIAKAVQGALHTERMPREIDEERTQVCGVELDSRKIRHGCVFVATRGERVDGHSFIGAAFSAGAMGVICEKAPDAPEGAYIVVRDSFQALRDLAEFYRKQLDIRVVGITGSVGKTSTKEFVASVLSKKFQTHKTAGNFNNEVGLPLTVLGIREGCEAAVLEMGISDFGEMHRLSKIARPDVCLITNIGQCHLEKLGTRDGILRAKTEIFDFMQEDGSVCLNGDDDRLATVREVKGRAPIFFGRDANRLNFYGIYATDYVNRGLEGSTVVLHVNREDRKEDFAVEIPLPGEHMLYNALAAAAVGVLFGLTAQQIQAGIRDVEPVGGRSHVIHTGQFTLIDDCYNANPVSVKAALDLLAMTGSARRVAILGDMFELGADETALHREVGGYAVQAGIDVLICVGGLCRNMYDGANQAEAQRSGRTQCYYFKDKEQLFPHIAELLREGDVILIKASHGMHFEEIMEKLR